MKLHFVRETDPAETRTPLLPATAARLIKLGARVTADAGIGQGTELPDHAYREAGVDILDAIPSRVSDADAVLRIRKPTIESIPSLAPGSLHISLLDPFREGSLVQSLAKAQVRAISLELIPRTTIAQKMDVLSSQANLAGYEAVIVAAERSPKLFPMMMTPAGTLAPARVFIIGVGVAGLQAIATARRLGAVVEAFDTRPVVEEQVKSLGARFLKVDLGQTGQTKDGYAQALTEEQLARQRDAMARACAQADVVITAAQVFGRKAPTLVTRAMLAGMRAGSVVVDMAVETGGNVEDVEPGTERIENGVRIVGIPALQTRCPVPASQMFANNLAAFVEHFWSAEAKRMVLPPEDEIVKGCLITDGGRIVHPVIRKALGLESTEGAGS